MKLYAIFGNPVAHSISPKMHNYLFQKLGFDGCYTKIVVEDGAKLKERFFDLSLKGINITVPHKEWAYKLADEVYGIAKEVEAVNTWYEKNGKIYAYNTDAPGFYESIKEYAFENILILGAGGTAKAIALYLKEKGYNPHILNRSAGRLQFFKERGFICYTWDEFEQEKYDLIINTTSAGLKDEALPAPQKILKPLMQEAKYAVDVIYNKLTPFLALARELGLTYKDGTQMLLYQGILAFEIFTDFSFNKEEITRVAKEALTL
ncbi:shikimate dehydrogenase [Nitratiruptor sp. YY09-18]|uniref:shikimate dehydrogenase n=1 Tax=Nitratiruptor sp. YY09-18 TaxID=2724901 RepID=UPI001914FF15|nr:shikimate dehydrogenase [Nitratiruptor sp. YY09-18]BCD67818.1 shikimate dehydrogenase [Nitratiruptor sp. YY09-18]